jgi:alcohol dehydrogenase
MGLPQPYAQSKPMSIEEVELDKPGERELLVQVKAASLCHSDLSTVNGDRPRPLPMVLGHEASGVVQEIGPGINDIKVGDHVGLVFAPSCGQCISCIEAPDAASRASRPTARANFNGGMRRAEQQGRLSPRRVSAFAEYCGQPARW